MKPKNPPGSYNAHWLALSSASSYEVMMGAPAFIYAKSLAASSTVLGITASLSALMSIFQLPAARHMSHFGYRRFLIFGWTIRAATIFIAAAVPMISFLDEESKLAVLLSYLSAYSFLGPLVVLPFGGRMLESAGGRVLMQVAGLGLAISMAARMLVAAGALPCSQLVVAVLNFTAGSAVAVFNLANLRVTMANVPELGRDHYFALFTVVTSLVLGIAQISWGLILDAIGNFEVIIAGFRWTRHTIYFLTLLVLNTVVIAYTPSVFHSARARTW